MSRVEGVYLDKTVSDRYSELEQRGKCLVTYVWVDGTGEATRSKTRTLDFVPKCQSEVPEWNYDGTYTGQAVDVSDDDLYLRPVRLYKDPFTLGDNKIALCETYDHNQKHVESNKRHSCLKVVEKAKKFHPWFGLEQMYTLYSIENHPFGWPSNGYPGAQGPYYCGVGADRVFGRDIIESHYRACLYTGIKISGTNAETAPSQWEFQIGPSEGIDGADDMWMARYFLNRVAEDYQVNVSLEAKPIQADTYGAEFHANFSTEEMRGKNGYKAIESGIEKIKKAHQNDIKLFQRVGSDTIYYPNFTYGIANRDAAIRIPRQCVDDGKGYLEDRRWPCNADPYVITEAIISAVCLN